MIKKDLP